MDIVSTGIIMENIRNITKIKQTHCIKRINRNITLGGINIALFGGIFSASAKLSKTEDRFVRVCRVDWYAK